MDASPERTEGHPTDGVACGGARRVGAMSDHGEGEPVRNRSAGTALLLSLAAATVVVAGLVLVPVAVGSVDRSGAAAKPSARTEGADVTLADVRTYEVRLGHQDGTIDYPQSPPVGGPHHPVWLDCGVYDVPVPEEHVVHDLEHGTTWLTYRPDLAEDQVAALAELLPSNGILSPYAAQDAPVVVTVWERQLDLTGADDPRLPLFLRELGGGATAPEPSASCAGGARLDQLDDLDRPDQPDQPSTQRVLALRGGLAASAAWTARS